MSAALTEKWQAASAAARRSEIHWPADCLDEAVATVNLLAASLVTAEAERDEARQRIALAVESLNWDRPYDTRIEATLDTLLDREVSP